VSETIFITGGTGFIGGYVVKELLDADPDVTILALTRAKDDQAFTEKMWKTLQMHVRASERPKEAAAEFYRLMERIELISGDLHAPGLGISQSDMDRIVKDVDSIIHIAASLNRKSAKACLNSNLRGTLSVVKVARAIVDGRKKSRKKTRPLRRFSHVSTAAVAGHRQSEVVLEDTAIDWDRSDYDPYGRTKKFCEHMINELLPDVQRTFFRPSIVLGDSRWPETTQFDMLRAFAFFVESPVVPFSGDIRVDTCNADWVGKAIAHIHMKSEPGWMIYNLANGRDSLTAGEIASSVAESLGTRTRFVGALETPFTSVMNTLGGWRARNIVTQIASLMKVFMPYITYDTVFENSRAVSELGQKPARVTDYYPDLHRFAKANNFAYPYVPLPARPSIDGDTVKGGKAA